MLSGRGSSAEAFITICRAWPLGPLSEADRRHPLLCAAHGGSGLDCRSRRILAEFAMPDLRGGGDRLTRRLLEARHTTVAAAAAQVLGQGDRGAIFPEAFDKVTRVQHALVLAAAADGDERHF